MRERYEQSLATILKLFLLGTICLVVILSSCSKRISEIPSDQLIHDNREYPSVPDGYYVISKEKYEGMIEHLELCKEIVLFKMAN